MVYMWVERKSPPGLLFPGFLERSIINYNIGSYIFQLMKLVRYF